VVKVAVAADEAVGVVPAKEIETHAANATAYFRTLKAAPVA
jgi:hypothetical protein